MNFSDSRAVNAGNDTASNEHAMTIEVFLDFICPWCLIGKRNLETALRRFAQLRPDVPIQVLWRSHQLLPGTPPEGMSYQAFYLARLGSPEAIATRRAQVRAAAHAAGITLAFERIEVLPNTTLAHRLLGCAIAHGTDAQQATLVERLFTAYFVEGRDIGNLQVLEEIGLECGLNHEAMLDHWTDSQEGRSGGLSPQAQHGISGVPTFVFNREFALSGAHAPHALLEALMQSAPA